MVFLKMKYRAVMRNHNRVLLLLDVTFKVIFIVLLLPVFSLTLEAVMKHWGQSYVTGRNLASFFSYPPVLFLFVVSVIVFSYYALLKMTTMINYTLMDQANPHPDILNLLHLGFLRTCRLLRKNKLLLPYALLLYLLLNLPTLAGITLYLRIPTELFRGGSDTLFLKGLILVILLFVGLLSFRCIFALHRCLTHGQLSEGVRLSKKLMEGRSLTFALLLLCYNLVFSLGAFLLYYLVLIITALFIYLSTERDMVITVFLSIYPKLNFYTVILAGTIAHITNLNLISTYYFKHRPKEPANSGAVPYHPRIKQTPVGRYRHITGGFLILIILFGLINLYHTIRNDSLYLKEALTGLQISSHRGFSVLAPENTLPSLEGAIKAHADYAEIDVQQTRDGSLVLMHDRSLWRTTGLNKSLSSLTLEEVKQLDAGSWFSKEFINTSIPTLEEAFRYCKGKIRLSIDIKVYENGAALAEKLVALIEQYEYGHQCIISSTDYSILAEVKTLNSELRTGLILSAAYGNFYGNEYVDFYSIHSDFISQPIVDSAHRNGKEIHAWTVNKISELERIKALGVDFIITDNPLLAREVLFRDSTNDTFIELLNHMLTHRSFYQLVSGGGG